jgi:phosphopentomutase
LDVGEPNLNSQIGQVITLFRLSDNMEHMWKQFEKLKSRKQGQLEIPFDFDEAGHTIEPLYDENKLSDFDQKLQKGLEYNLKDKEAN